MPKQHHHEMRGFSRFSEVLIAGSVSLAMSLLLSIPVSASSITLDDPRLTPARIVSYDTSGFTQVFIDGYIRTSSIEPTQPDILGLRRRLL